MKKNNIKFLWSVFQFITIVSSSLAQDYSNIECKSEFSNQRFEIVYRHPGNFIGDPDDTMFLEFDDNQGFNYTSSLSGFGSIDISRNEVGVQKMVWIFNTHKIQYYNCALKKTKCLDSLKRITKDLNEDFLFNVKMDQDELNIKIKAIKCALIFSRNFQYDLL